MNALPPITLVLGGARSGKSSFAEKLVLQSGLMPFYVATGQVWDEEMRDRVDAHVARRGPEWTTVEAPDALDDALAQADAPGRAILVDCLTLWVTNLMMAEAEMDARFAALCDQLAAMDVPVVLVSNEVGLGIVPDNAMARAFRDYAGRLHQMMAQQAHKVYFVAAGLPLTMKG